MAAGFGITLVFAFALGLAPLSASALILASGDGLHNTEAPADDPGWGHVGFRNTNTAVYLGDGWVLSAAHVGQGEVFFHEVNTTYLASPRPAIILDNSPGGPQAEVKLWRLMADPGLPTLSFPTTAPFVTVPVTLVARGLERGIPVFWNGFNGWQWAATEAMRWGTNRVTERDVDITLAGRTTRSFVMEFTDDGDTADEAIVANGDSGGAVFVKQFGSWTLAGILYGRSEHAGQPATYALDFNDTYAVDLPYFAADIAAVTAERACSDGSDDDGDGLVDYPADPGCQSASDAFETDANMACDDGFDNDGDGLRDVADPGCLNPQWSLENPACDDDGDNDGDGGIDWDGGSGGGSPDSYCVGHPYRTKERPNSCGLGFELALLVPLLARLRRHSRLDFPTGRGAAGHPR